MEETSYCIICLNPGWSRDHITCKRGLKLKVAMHRKTHRTLDNPWCSPPTYFLAAARTRYTLIISKPLTSLLDGIISGAESKIVHEDRHARLSLVSLQVIMNSCWYCGCAFRGGDEESEDDSESRVPKLFSLYRLPTSDLQPAVSIVSGYT